MSEKTSSSKLKHKTVKQALSLPIVSAPSGGIRIKRKDLNKKDIYQLVAANTPATAISQGFPIDNEKRIDWGKTVNMSIYSQDRLTSIDLDTCDPNENAYVSMDTVVEVYRTDIITIKMSPGTKDRRIIYIDQSFEDFRICLNKPNLLSYFDLSNEISLNKDECKKFGMELSKLIDGKINCGIPRNGKLILLSIGNKISYYYKVESSNAKMNLAFESALNE